MITQQAQIKINLPSRLKEYVEAKAAKFGLPIATYVKHLIVKDVEDMQYPEFEPSEKVVKAYKKARKDYEAGKTIRVKNLDKFFEQS